MRGLGVAAEDSRNPCSDGAGDPVAYASRGDWLFKARSVQMPRNTAVQSAEADEKMISYLDGTCRMEIEPIQKIEQLEEDVPLCSFDKVQSTVRS